MARSPNSFAKRLRAFAGDLPRQQLELKKNVAVEVGLQIIEATPVDTGQARNNWFTALGSPDTTSLMNGPFGPGARGGIAAANRVKVTASAAKLEDPIYISNNLPYIERLNEGYSAQAPADFVEIAIKRGQAIIQKQRIRYKV